MEFMCYTTTLRNRQQRKKRNKTLNINMSYASVYYSEYGRNISQEAQQSYSKMCSPSWDARLSSLVKIN
jgi:hypothetical protein